LFGIPCGLFAVDLASKLGGYSPSTSLEEFLTRILVPIDLIQRYVKSAPVFSHKIADLKYISFAAKKLR
jgi:hypothetical protein